jgi:hypothetical protein
MVAWKNRAPAGCRRLCNIAHMAPAFVGGSLRRQYFDVSKRRSLGSEGVANAGAMREIG